MIDNEKPSGASKGRLVSVLILMLVVVLSLLLFFWGRNPEVVGQLLTFGYLGAFLVSVITNATVILPVPGIIVLFALGATLNPILVALVGATGGVIGETTGFLAGYSGRGVIQTRQAIENRRVYARVDRWMRRWGGWGIFFFAVVPLPVLDIAGLAAGALRYPFLKFLVIVWIGKSLKYIFLVIAGVQVWQSLLRWIG